MNLDIVTADIPFLIVLDIIDEENTMVDNTENVICRKDLLDYASNAKRMEHVPHLE